MVAVAAFVVLILLQGNVGHADERCSRVLVFTLPGVTWSDVARVRPKNLLRLVGQGAAGSISVRTLGSINSYASAFATIGAGSPLDAPASAASDASVVRRRLGFARVRIARLRSLETRARNARYGGEPGALAASVRGTAVTAIGNADLGRSADPARRGRWTLLAAMNRAGIVEKAATGTSLLEVSRAAPWGVRTSSSVIERIVRRALKPACGVVVVDQGDLARAEQLARLNRVMGQRQRDAALRRADALLGRIAGGLDVSKDLLLVVTPTSPAWASDEHLGVAIAVGPGFARRSALESATTRRAGIVSLPDVAPTVVTHFGLATPKEMTGRPWFSVRGPPHLVAQAVELDRASVFAYRMLPRVSSAFAAFQLVVYLVVVGLVLGRPKTRPPGVKKRAAWRAAEAALLAVVAFPVCTYLAGLVPGLPPDPWIFAGSLVAMDAALVGLAWRLVGDGLGRLLVLTGFTAVVLLGDLVSGSHLQLSTVFGSLPVVGARFTGAGNITFAVLSAASLVTGALLMHRWPASGAAAAATAALFGATVIVDGSPQWGADVGGTLTLVPTFIVAWSLLSGRRPSARTAAAVAVAAALALATFLAVDLARAPQSQTHLARLYEDVVHRGAGVLIDTVARKTGASLGVFRASIWSAFVPVAVACAAWLVIRLPGRWRRLAIDYPRIRAGLIAGILLAIVGGATNDSGVVISALVLSFLVPVACVVHLAIARGVPA